MPVSWTDYERGKKRCVNCRYYVLSEKISDMYRCAHPDNIEQRPVGKVYLQSPDKNWDGKCDDYSELS